MFGWLTKQFEGIVTPVRGSYATPVQQPNVSEPVLTLLDMLAQDEWEVRKSLSTYHTAWTIINAYNECVHFYIYLDPFNYLGPLDDGYIVKLVGKDWMTSTERSLVAAALEQIAEREDKRKAAEVSNKGRTAFAKLLNVKE